MECAQQRGFLGGVKPGAENKTLARAAVTVGNLGAIPTRMVVVGFPPVLVLGDALRAEVYVAPSGYFVVNPDCAQSATGLKGGGVAGFCFGLPHPEIEVAGLERT